MILGIDYNTLWFLVFGAVITGYAILDGFDLGAGALHLFLKKEKRGKEFLFVQADKMMDKLRNVAST